MQRSAYTYTYICVCVYIYSILNSNGFLGDLIFRKAKLISVMFTLKVTFREIIGAEILTAVLIKTGVSWFMTPCKLVNSYRLTGLLHPESGGSTLRRIVGNYYRSTLKP